MGAHFNANIINLGDVNELNDLELDKYLFVSNNQNSINLSKLILKDLIYVFLVMKHMEYLSTKILII